MRGTGTWGERAAQVVLFPFEVAIGVPLVVVLGLAVGILIALGVYLGLIYSLVREGIAALRKPRSDSRPPAPRAGPTPMALPKKPPLYMAPWRGGRPN